MEQQESKGWQQQHHDLVQQQQHPHQVIQQQEEQQEQQQQQHQQQVKQEDDELPRKDPSDPIHPVENYLMIPYEFRHAANKRTKGQVECASCGYARWMTLVGEINRAEFNACIFYLLCGEPREIQIEGSNNVGVGVDSGKPMIWFIKNKGVMTSAGYTPEDRAIYCCACYSESWPGRFAACVKEVNTRGYFMMGANRIHSYCFDMPPGQPTAELSESKFENSAPTGRILENCLRYTWNGEVSQEQQQQQQQQQQEEVQHQVYDPKCSPISDDFPTKYSPISE